MAITKVTRGLLNTGISDSSDATAITIDSSENVTVNTGNLVIGTSLALNAGADITGSYGNWTGDKAGKIQFHSNNLYCQYTSNFLIRNSSGLNRVNVDVSGNAIFAGNVTQNGNPSDIKLKENIEIIANPLDKIKQLKGITYTLKSNGDKLTGLIAQDLEKVLPEAVYTAETMADEINGEESEEFLAIRYGNTVGLLVEAIKEQQAIIDDLKTRIEVLEA
tara:strand:- start:1000 stop:1659 length:660 start_codon:yes stop_codon:yes gene_type:complete